MPYILILLFTLAACHAPTTETALDVDNTPQAKSGAPAKPATTQPSARR